MAAGKLRGGRKTPPGACLAGQWRWPNGPGTKAHLSHSMRFLGT